MTVRDLDEMRTFKKAEDKNITALEMVGKVPDLRRALESALADLREAHRQYVAGELPPLEGPRFSSGMYVEQVFDYAEIGFEADSPEEGDS